eukprot:s1361_g5.t1
MGWLSSVSLMQEISDHLLLQNDFPADSQIARHRPLPLWMTGLLREARANKRAWWHVYLDNYAGGQIVDWDETAVEGERLHQLAEEAWREAQVMSSEKKRKRGVLEAEELGALVSGKTKTIGASPQRFLRLIHATLWVLSRKHLAKKHVQVLAGRWVHVLQFRRPGMSFLEAIWEFISSKKFNATLVVKVRRELWMCVCAVPLLHTNLGAGISPVTTASDASMRGGAVGIARELTAEGMDYVNAAVTHPPGGASIPIVVLSLFHGIGGSFRVYDVMGLSPLGLISFEINPAANRVSSRRWPHSLQYGDVRELDHDLARSWLLKFVGMKELHVWAGFPCTDLTSVKAFREGLDGEQSRLFYEVPRILSVLEDVCGGEVKIKFVGENVASMGKPECEEISQTLGVWPYHLDCAHAVPMNRPRLCWCSESLEGVADGLQFEEEEFWTRVIATAPYPDVSQWLEPGAEWPGEQEAGTFPTAPRAIVRTRPPPRPAGYERCDPDTLSRRGGATALFQGSGSLELALLRGRWQSARVCAMLVVAILPAHLMRSVAGGFDNECMAVSLMNSTFYFWCRSLRSDSSWPWAFLAALSYFCMVSTWGGYVFVVNVIACHAFCLMLWRHSTKLHRSFTIFFMLGTGLAVWLIPVVGWTPLRSLEQLLPLLQFLALQVMELLAVWQWLRPLPRPQLRQRQVQALLAASSLVVLVGAVMFQLGYFAPLSARVRGLFVKHRTGNPLVDSVAEHQATSPRAYWQFFHHICVLAPLGFVVTLFQISEAKSFLLLYGAITYYFSAKMNRLILLLGPIAASLGGVGLATAVGWALRQWMEVPTADRSEGKAVAKGEASAAKAKSKKSKDAKTASVPEKEKKVEKSSGPEANVENWRDMLLEVYEELKVPFLEAYYEAKWQRKASSVLMLLMFVVCGMEFINYCWLVGERLSQASIILKRRTEDGEVILIDDYRQAYWWLRDQTPEDSRVMAWWDYGYQINGLSNRTTLADGNTWNHEHIALLGKCLTGPEKASYEVIRHLADYVLIWAGDNGDDIAKSPHMARIATSVYHDVCPGDPLCTQFHLNRQTREPSDMMKGSLLWKMYAHERMDNESVDPELFEEAFTSEHGYVRIFKVLNISQESKSWAADPENWLCDAPGSWLCQGQYPPALAKILQEQNPFKQLEDFNVHRDSKAEEYHAAYMKKVSKEPRRT